MSLYVNLCCCSVNYEMITSICAIIISIISLLTSIIFSIIQMSHDKKSVRPIANLVCRNYADEIAIRLENVGIGPLIVSDLMFKSNDKEDTDIISLIPNIDQGYATYIKGLKGNAVGAGETKILIQVNPRCPDSAEKVRGALKNIIIVLEYQDIYGKKFTEECNLNDVYGNPK